MNRNLIFLAAWCLFPLSSLSAQNIVNVKPAEPLSYRQKDGRLELLEAVVMSSACPDKAVLTIDGCPLAYERTARQDSVVAWMPMIGDSYILELSSKGRLCDSRHIDAPVQKDWGYFAGGEIHIIQSSHQDIAWMDTPDHCREERIRDIIIPALDMMKEDSSFTFEMEQTLNLMELLEACPERKAEVEQRLGEGRFTWGATYNQPYEGLSSGEQLVRQAYYGRKWVKDNFRGCDINTAFNPDVPGRAAQMPQILAKSGIPNMFVSRMKEGLYDWSSPDGTAARVFSVGHYGWEKFVWHFFDRGVINAFGKVHDRVMAWGDYYRQHSLAPVYAVIMSNDASMPDSYSELIDSWNEIAALAEVPLPRLKYSTMERFLAAVNTPASTYEKIKGERPDLWLYIHGPAHYEQTLDKRLAAILLPSAELLSTVNHFSGGAYPDAELRRGWMASIYPDHGLGGKHGEITDAIFSDSLAVGRSIGGNVLRTQLERLVSRVSGDEGDVLVFNDLPWSRYDIAEVRVSSREVTVTDGKGQEVPFQIRMRGDTVYASFMAEVPSMGYSTYKVTPRKRRAGRMSEEIRCGSNYYSNGFYDMVFGDGGIVKLFDRELGKDVLESEKFALGDVIDAEYRGNGAGEFVRITDLTVLLGDLDRAGGHPAEWKITETGPLFTTYTNRVPMRNAVLVQNITIYNTIKKIDFDVCLENFTGEHGRQFRIMFPAKMNLDSSEIDYETPFFISRVGRDELDMIPGGYSAWGTYTQPQSEIHPREVQNFISAGGDGFGMTLSSCVAVCDWLDPSIEMSDYPILQGILLSSHKSCHGEGNWYHQTGTHHFHFSLTTHSRGWKNGYAQGVSANHPFYVTVKNSRKGSLPRSDSFLTISEPFVSVSSLKMADEGDAVILRLAELEGVDKDVEVSLPFDAVSVVRCDMIENGQDTLPVSGRTINLHLPHHSVETFKIYFPAGNQ